MKKQLLNIRMFRILKDILNGFDDIDEIVGKKLMMSKKEFLFGFLAARNLIEEIERVYPNYGQSED